MTTQTQTQIPKTIEKKMPAPRHTARSTKAETAHTTQYIDATNLVVGRMASVVAQNLLRGHTVNIAHAENAVFTGNPVLLVKLWQTRLDLRPLGNPEKGPRFHKTPDRIVREIIEGMLPSRRERGVNALKRLRVYIGIPAQPISQKWSSIEEARNRKTKGIIRVKELSQKLGYHLLK